MVNLNDKDKQGLFDRLSNFYYLDEEVLGVGWGDGRTSFLDRKELTPLAGSKFNEATFKNSKLLKSSRSMMGASLILRTWNTTNLYSFG